MGAAAKCRRTRGINHSHSLRRGSPVFGSRGGVEPQAPPDGGPAQVALFAVYNDHRQDELPDQAYRDHTHPDGGCPQRVRFEIWRQRQEGDPGQDEHGQGNRGPDAEDLGQAILFFCSYCFL